MLTDGAGLIIIVEIQLGGMGMRLSIEKTLADGTTLTLRSLEKEDAAAAIWLLRRVAGETDFLMRQADECSMTIAQEAAYIDRMNESPREAFVGAFVSGELIGMANLSRVSAARRAAHRAGVGVSVERAHWSCGVGTALMRALIDCAEKLGYEQIELQVVDKNARAIALYERLGFTPFARIPGGVRYDDGEKADILYMVLLLQSRAEV